ncbi:MAG TPA: outer membrane beta-barrel protein [Bryobacteraceae bacterium]|nr:outer membrane beta-barrel protein [Bryobacteraceae bacterium]
MKLGLLISILFVSSGFAQHWDIGAMAGYGAYRDVRINSAGGTADAGIRDRFTVGGLVGEDLFSHISGEVRYLYQDGDPFLSLGGARGNIQGQSHTFSYDLLFHVYDRDRRFRPFVAVGSGGKYYRTTGPAPVPQPFPQIATLARVNEWQFVGDFGVGFKYRLHNHVMLRGDFRDYITPFPKKLFVPASNGTDRGLFQQFTPTFGIGYWF